MITLTDAALSVLTRSYRLHLRVESWLGEELLAETVPVAVASEEGDRGLNVPERVSLTIPRTDRGMSWSPVEADHPLAANGQRLRVQLGVGVAGEPEWFQRGWFVIHNSKADADTVTVNAVGLLHLIHEARLVSPFQPTGTLVSTLRGLIEPALTVEVDSGLTDRAVPAGINYDEDRLGAVNELLDAWPADAYVTEEGYLYVEPPATVLTAPVLTLTNGTGGTVIEATGSSSREDGYNAAVARGTASDGGQVQGVAFDPTGPKRYGGNFNPLPVPYFFASPLLTTVAQAQAAANTVLARIKRQTALRFDAQIVPHPALQLGDVVSITTDDYTDLLCTIEALRLPWTPDSNEPQMLTLRSLT
jgi:hypothetical protein